MAAYSVIARHLCTEASSGTGPTECADDEGSHDLTITYDSNANWTTLNSAGDALETIDADGGAMALVSDMSAAGSIGGQLDGLKEVSVLWTSDISEGASAGSRIISLSKSGGDGMIAILITPTQIRLRFAEEDSGGQNIWTHDGAVSSGVYGIHTFCAVFNSAEATSQDRAKLYIDGSATSLSSAGDDIPENKTLSSQQSDMGYAILNRYGGGRQVHASVGQVEIGSGVLTADQASDYHDAVNANNDANWQGGTPAAVTKDEGGGLTTTRTSSATGSTSSST